MHIAVVEGRCINLGIRKSAKKVQSYPGETSLYPEENPKVLPRKIDLSTVFHYLSTETGLLQTFLKGWNPITDNSFLL